MYKRPPCGSLRHWPFYLISRSATGQTDVSQGSLAFISQMVDSALLAYALRKREVHICNLCYLNAQYLFSIKFTGTQTNSDSIGAIYTEIPMTEIKRYRRALFRRIPLTEYARYILMSAFIHFLFSRPSWNTYLLFQKNDQKTQSENETMLAAM